MTDIFSIQMLISELNINTKSSIILEHILLDNNIRLREHSIGFDMHNQPILGACKSEGLKRLIVISPSINNYHRKRFTIAHEIGHIFLHHGNRQCIATDFQFWRDKLMKESEANTFAAELLLPYVEIKAALMQKDVSFNLVDTLAGQFETSLSATAIRLVKADNGMSAVIYHDGKTINWIVRSSNCRNDIEQSLVSDLSLYSKTNEEKNTIQGTVDPAIWFTGDVEDWLCNEETRYFRKIGKYLTILNVFEQ